MTIEAQLDVRPGHDSRIQAFRGANTMIATLAAQIGSAHIAVTVSDYDCMAEEGARAIAARLGWSIPSHAEMPPMPGEMPVEVDNDIHPTW